MNAVIVMGILCCSQPAHTLTVVLVCHVGFPGDIGVIVMVQRDRMCLCVL